ncbi:uncharacterized protein LOC135461734 isoform X2 [Liolophura sinensis]|uniref:uncharacterized protein LOC135461734 isoform X2 n=1 Tax=Liolophura sinensis TaxID=3198878 RepID=UPI003158970C
MHLAWFTTIAIVGCVRQRSRYKKAAPKQNILTIVGDEMESSSTLPTKVSSLGTENRADYWSNMERRGQQTEEKVRRMNIADNFEELGRYAPPHAPPPPILRSVGFDMKERSATNANGALVTDASRGSQPETMRVSAVSAASAAVIYHNPNPPEPLDLLDQPSTSYDPKPEYAPVIRETGDHDGMEAVGVKTPNPLNFQTPEEDGFYRLQVE